MTFQQTFSTNFKSRKFHVLVGLISLSSCFLYAEKMTAQEWIDFNKWIFGIYAAGNVTTKATDVWRVASTSVASSKKSE